MLDKSTLQIIKASLPTVKAHADDITSCFYPLMFEQYPEVIPYFNQTNQVKGTQPKALASAVVAYASHLDALGNLSDAVSKIVQKHCSLGVLPEQYEIVGNCLLQAIATVLGEVATVEVLDAWGKAYGQLADILIEAEEAVYAGTEKMPGGWRGERSFVLVKREEESSVITSFYLEPADHGGLPDFDAGQFITLVLDVDGQSVRRNYSLSDAPGTGYFRISVKREPQGMVSNYLHDRLQLGDQLRLLPPCGTFVLRRNDKPLVLLTGGMGITPAISMLNVEADSGREILFIHASRHSKVHAFKKHVDELTQTHSNISSLTVYSEPGIECRPDVEGHMTSELISTHLPKDRDVEFYFLGPKTFMGAAFKIAQEVGIPENQIHYEFFGPEEQLAS